MKTSTWMLIVGWAFFIAHLLEKYCIGRTDWVPYICSMVNFVGVLVCREVEKLKSNNNQ